MSFKKKDVLKIVLLGPPQTGKRALIQQFVNRRWVAETVQFDPFDVPKKLIAVEEKQVTLELYPVDSIDTLTATLNGASCDGCLLIYDLSNKNSFHHLITLLAEFLSHNLISSQMTPPPIMIVGNKYDLGSTKREVTKEAALNWTQNLVKELEKMSAITEIPNLSALTSKFELYEVSAKTADQIETVFYRIARLALNLSHNMFAGTVSHNALQNRLCLVDGCVQQRIYRGYCATHANMSEKNSILTLKTEDFLLPTLFILNKSINDQNPRQSPFHLALLGSIRHLIVSITSDKERIYRLLPQNENDIYKTGAQLAALQRSPKSDRGSIISLDQSKPVALPRILYNTILDINKTQMDLVTLVTPPKDKKNLPRDDKDRIMMTTIPVEQYSGDNAPQRNRLAILDVTITTNPKMIPPNYTVIQKAFFGRKADLNSGSGGKDVYICVLRDTPQESDVLGAGNAFNLTSNNDEVIPTQPLRWNVYANGVQRPIENTIVTTAELDTGNIAIEGSCLSEELLKRAHAVIMAQKGQTTAPQNGQKKPAVVNKKKGKPKPEIKINLLSQLLPITAVNLALILPKVREDAPFGFEIVSNMPDSALANLNAGTQSETQIYFALHRAGPGPDYNLYAKDLFGEGSIDKSYIETSDLFSKSLSNTRSSFIADGLESPGLGPRDSAQNFDFHALSRTQSMLAAPLIASPTAPNITAAHILTPNDIYALSKNPLTILTEDSRSMVQNYPLGGSRGPGAPIVDINIIFPQRGEVCPPDWHEVNTTLQRRDANLNMGTDGNEVKTIFKVDPEPVLHKVYKPFLEVLTLRSNEANVLGVDNQVLLQFTQFCALLTTCLYSPNLVVVLDTLAAIKQLIKPDSATTTDNTTSLSPVSTSDSGSTGKAPPPPPPPPKLQNLANILPPQIFNAFVHTLCDAAPMLLGILHNNERTVLLEVCETIIDRTYNILSSYTVMRLLDVFILFRSTDMILANDSSSMQTADSQTASQAGGDLWGTNYNSVYLLQHSLRLLRPIVTSANQSVLKHQGTEIHQSPMARLDPNGNYPRLVDLVLRHQVFDEGAVLLGMGRKGANNSSGDYGNKNKNNLQNSTPLLTKSPQLPPLNSSAFTPPSPTITLSSLASKSPLPAPPTLPSSASPEFLTMDPNQPTPQPNQPLSFSIGSQQRNNQNTTNTRPFGFGQPTKKLSQAELVHKSRSQEEISTIVTNINNNPYDMCASLMRFLADQVVSSKITDQEIGRLQRRTYGSQPLGDLASITDRLINDHHTQRNWLIDPPVGYGISPELRQTPPSIAPPQALSPYVSAIPPLNHSNSLNAISLNGPNSSNDGPGSPLMSSQMPDIPFTFNQLAQQQSTVVPELPHVGSVSSATIHEDILEPRHEQTPTMTPSPAPTTQLSQLLLSRKQLTIDVNDSIPQTPIITPNIPPSSSSRRSLVTLQNPRNLSPYTTFTRIFGGNSDFNPDGTPYVWRYFKIQHTKHETEADRRKRKKAEKAMAQEIEAKHDALMFEEHRQELAARRVTIHNTQHLWSNNLILYKPERTLLSLIIYLSKLASSDSDLNPLHASSVRSLVNINIMAYPSVGLAYKAASPYGLMPKDEMILRRVYSLQLIHYILDKSDEFLKSNHASINVIRRYIVPAIINNTVTLVPSMFFISLKCYVILCEKYGTECQAEIGLMLHDVFLELLISPAAPVDFKVHIFELLELVLSSPIQVINLYQTQDNSGQRNVYEKLLQTVSVIILQTQYARNEIGSAKTVEPTDIALNETQQLYKRHNLPEISPADCNLNNAAKNNTNRSSVEDDPDGPKRVEQVVVQYNSGAEPKKSLLDLASERLRKCALRLLMHHLHMLAQWTGVPTLKRSLDATNALKLTCKSFLHVLICSDSFTELITTTPDYTRAIQIAARKLNMLFEGFPHTASTRPYIQMPGILEEVMRVEGEKTLKQLLGLNSGLTRVNNTLSKERLGELTPKGKSMADNTNLRSIARQVMIETMKAGLSASSLITLVQAQAQYQQAAQTQHSTLGHRGSLGMGLGKGQAEILKLQQDMLTKQNQQATHIDYDMDGGYIEIKQDTSGSVPTLQQTFEKMGDEVCVSVQRLLGDVPQPQSGLELGLDLGHYSSMDPYTISMVKNNPSFALMLTNRSPLSKQRLEYGRVYKEASILAQGKDSLKEMLKFLHTNYPRWLTPYNIAQLLYQNPYIEPAVVGDYISSQDDKYFSTDQFNQLRTAYTNLIDLSGMPFISALRYYLTNGGFRMPGEGQKISRLVESFCQAFTRDNPDEFANVDLAGVVCFAAIMLNTELHNPSSQQIAKKNSRPPMTLAEFINNILSAPAGRRTDILSLVNIYIEISGQAIEWIGDNSNHDHFDTALTLEQLLSRAANGQAEASFVDIFDDEAMANSNLTQQELAILQLRESIKSQSKLRLLRRRALCDVRSVGPLSSRNDFTSSTQIMSVMWSHVWQFYLRSIASKMDSSPFFSPQSLRGGSSQTSNAGGLNTSGIEHLSIDESDYETLHMCIDCLAYGTAVSIALGDHDARKPFMRSLAKIVFLETQNSRLFQQELDDSLDQNKEKKRRDDPIITHTLSPQLQNQILSGEHYKQPWYTNLETLSTHSPVLACKMLLSIANNTKSNISFQRRQHILRVIEREFGGKENINLSSDTERAFIRKSKLIKLSSSNKKQVYTFFLFNDLLIYAEEESNTRYKIHQVLHLSLLRIVSLIHLTRPLEEKRQETLKKFLALRDQLTQNNNTPNSHNNPKIAAENAAIAAELAKITIPPKPTARFKIISPQKTFTVECANEEEMTSWVSVIQDCITKLLVKRSDWGIKAKEAIKSGVLHPDILAAKKIFIDTKKKRIENKEDVILSVMDAKGNITDLNAFYKHDVAQYQAYLRSLPKNTFPVTIERSLQLKKYAVFSGSSSHKLSKLSQEGFVSATASFCKLCLRPYAFRRGTKTCQHCGEDVCSDCTKSIDVLIQPMVKVKSIRACHSCVGLLPAPSNEEGRGLIGDNQPIFQIGDDEDEL